MHGAKCSKCHISAAVLLETINNILDLDLIHNIQIDRIASHTRYTRAFYSPIEDIGSFQCYE